jgi:hypothetical protein
MNKRLKPRKGASGSTAAVTYVTISGHCCEFGRTLLSALWTGVRPWAANSVEVPPTWPLGSARPEPPGVGAPMDGRPNASMAQGGS